jgi:hypothetical protein
MLFAIIPEEKREAVDAALREVFGHAEIERATPLRDGFSGAHVVRVEARGHSALLRVEAVRDALRDPARQYACTAAAAEAGIAPPLRYADAETGVAVMDFVEARPFADYPGGREAAALELAGLTRRLRATPRFPDLVDQIDGVDGLLQGVVAAGVIAPDAVAPHLAAWTALKDAYPRTPPAERTSSHNDLNPNNIVYDGQRLWLIDWEVAFANDPLVDPASIALWFGIPHDGEAALLEASFGAVDEQLRARFFLMRQVSQLFNGVLMLRLAAQGPQAAPVGDMAAPPFVEVRAGLASRSVDLASAEGRLLFAKAALNGVRDTVQSPAFEAARRVLEG